MHLFKRKQRGGWLWMGTMGGLMGFLAAKSGTRTTSAGNTTTLQVTPLGWGVQVGLFAGVGGRKLIRFNNQELFKALAAHDDKRPWPGYVDNKLKDKDYK